MYNFIHDRSQIEAIQYTDATDFARWWGIVFIGTEFIVCMARTPSYPSYFFVAHETGMPANRICFEITETAAITNLSQAKNFIAAGKKLGCRFALDDFGAGMSSFSYLKHLSVDYLKIDGSFVKDIVNDPVDREMVRHIHEIGRISCAKHERILKIVQQLATQNRFAFFNTGCLCISLGVYVFQDLATNAGLSKAHFESIGLIARFLIRR